MPITDLPSAVRNPKAHSDEMVGSVTRFGFVEPMTLDERTGRLVSGHGRRDELLRRQAAGEAPPDGIVLGDEGVWLAPVTRGWSSRSDAEAEAFVVAANRIGERGGWNDSLLADVLVDLRDLDSGLEGVGYDVGDLDALLERLGRDVDVSAHQRHIGDPDAPPPDPPVTPFTQPGDLWLLGPHRLLCGDATSAEDHDSAIGGYAMVDLVLTDPPYGVGVDYGSHMDDSPEAVAELVGKFMPLVLLHPRALITSGHRCMWDYPRPTWLLGWVHPAGSGANSWGFTCLNPVLAYGKDPYLAAGLGRRPDTLVLTADREGIDGHPVVKPLAVWRWLIERGTIKEGQVVFDPFMGSGTTLIAAQVSGRVAVGIELAPAFVDVGCARWQQLTGVLPVLERTGEPHDFIAS